MNAKIQQVNLVFRQQMILAGPRCPKKNRTCFKFSRLQPFSDDECFAIWAEHDRKLDADPETVRRRTERLSRISAARAAGFSAYGM